MLKVITQVEADHLNMKMREIVLLPLPNRYEHYTASYIQFDIKPDLSGSFTEEEQLQYNVLMKQARQVSGHWYVHVLFHHTYSQKLKNMDPF